MPTDQDQYRKIFGIFMEEAQEHLDTLETGLKNLPAIMADSDRERITAMYRAAHSLKGGSAMLMKDVPSLSSINKVSKRLEDCFKSVKDTPIKVDSTAQTLSNKGYEVIKNLITRCQSGSGLSPQMGEKIAVASLPLYEKLENHLQTLMSGKGETKPIAAIPGATAAVMKVLKPMLQLLKKPPSTASRQQLLKLSLHLAKIGANVEPWQNLIKTIQIAIKNPKNSHKDLAGTVVKELQLAGKLLEAGKASAIAPSAALQQLASGAAAAPAKEITIPADPKEVVKVLLKTFNKKQLQAIAQLLIKQIKS